MPAEVAKKEKRHTKASLCFVRIWSRRSEFSQSAKSILSSRFGTKSTSKNVKSQYRIAVNVRTRTIFLTISSRLLVVSPSAQWNRQMSKWPKSTAEMYVRYVRKKMSSSS